MSFFKKLFGLGGDDEPKARRISHPRDLRAGDIIKFQYLDQSEISGKQFEVSQVNTYIYGDLCYPEIVLKDTTGVLLYLMVEEEDGEEYLAISKKIDKAKIRDLIPENVLQAVRSQASNIDLSIKSKLSGFDDWLSTHYKCVDSNVKGSYLRGDARDLSDEQIARREYFNSHIFEDSNGDYAIEIEAYKTGEIEASATIYKEIRDIEEMWPNSDQE